MAMNNSLAEVHPELVSEWSEKNLPLIPDDITFGSNKKSPDNRLRTFAAVHCQGKANLDLSGRGPSILLPQDRSVT